jgi:hypothetical protein
MAKMSVHFQKVIQDSQEFGSDDEHMVSRVFFDLLLDGKRIHEGYVNIKQTVGSDFATGLIEVYPIEGYEGPMDFQRFQKVVTMYFRDLIGSKGSAINFGDNVRNLRMQNNTFITPRIFHFEVDA